MLFIRTSLIRRKIGVNYANVYLILSCYMFILYLTDNVYAYYSPLMTFLLICMSYTRLKGGNKTMPKVSVIMSTYREPLKWVESAVESILSQSLTDFEFIIVIDDPKNKLIIEYLESIEDTRVVLLKNESNLGLVRSLNKALEVCKSDYIARMDADDISLPERLEKQVTFMKTQNYDLCGTWYELFDDTHVIRISNPPQSSIVCERVLRYENCVAHPSWMVRKKYMIL